MDVSSFFALVYSLSVMIRKERKNFVLQKCSYISMPACPQFRRSNSARHAYSHRFELCLFAVFYVVCVAASNYQCSIFGDRNILMK